MIPGRLLGLRIERPIRPMTSSIAGAIGAVFGLFFYAETGDAASVWSRDAMAGALIGGMIGYALNVAVPLRDRAWSRLARASTWGAIAGASGGAIGLIVGEVVLGTFTRAA